MVGLIVVLGILLGALVAYQHRQIDFMEFVGLTEFRERPFLQVFMAMNPQQSVQLLFGLLRLVISLLPVAIFNSLPLFLILAVIPWGASRFIQTLYDVKDFKEAHQFLHRNVFGMHMLKPILIVKEGKIAVGAGDLHDRIGGRCFLIVYHDSAIVLENGGRLTRVVGPSLSFMRPHERIWGIVDLRPQRWPFSVSAMTKDGIPISCEADITFKIDDREKDEDGNVIVKAPVKKEIDAGKVTDAEIMAEMKKAGIAEPLPYTEEAVFRAATSIWIRIHQLDHPEQLRYWTGRVILGDVEGALRSILMDYRLDDLLRAPKPGQEKPREEIRQRLAEKLQKAFSVDNAIGARILQVNLGEFHVRDVQDVGIPDKVYSQWIQTWEAGWRQRAMVGQIEREEKLAQVQATQVRAQAEMVLTLTERIRPLVNDTNDVTSYLLAMRFIETLRWMAYDPFKRAFLPPEIIRTLDELDKALDRTIVRGTEKDEALDKIGRLLLDRGVK